MNLISEDSNESAFNFNTISNGPKTERELPNKIVAEALDDINRMMKEVKLKNKGLFDGFNVMPSDNKPYTTWSPSDRQPETWFTMHKEPLDKLFEFDKQTKIERDWSKPEDSYNLNHFDTGIHIPERDTRFDNFDFKLYMPTPASPQARTGALAFRALGGVVGGILALILIANVCRKKDNRTRRGVVLVPGAAVGAGTVQQDMETNRRLSGQGGFPPQLVICQPSGADPPNIDLPPSYSECINKNVSEPPPPYTNPADTEPLVHNGLVEIGFRNDCVAMTTTPNDSEGVKTELVFDNGRIVERLSLDLNKETEQGTTQADVKDRVVYVDETSTPTRR